MKCKIEKDNFYCRRNEGHEGPCAMEYKDESTDDYVALFELMSKFTGEDWTEIIEMFPELKKQINGGCK